MQGFTTPNTKHPVTLSFTTDTQTPQASIPVFLIHTTERPFCSNLNCECHQNQAAIAALLEAIMQGEMTLREAADFADGKQV